MTKQKVNTLIATNKKKNDKCNIIINYIGMKEYEYESDYKTAKKFRLLDVGGQRAERKKWINYFDKFRYLIFCL